MSNLERQKLLEAKIARLELQLDRQMAQSWVLGQEMDKTASELENARMDMAITKIQRTDYSPPFALLTFIEMDVSANV